LGTVNQL
jgi:hypothetical protein